MLIAAFGFFIFSLNFNQSKNLITILKIQNCSEYTTIIIITITGHYDAVSCSH